jgi:exosortase
LFAVKKYPLSFFSSILIFAGIIVWLYFPVLSNLVAEWYENPNHSHGFLVPFIAGYFIWLQRENLSSVDLKPDNRGSLVILAGLLMYYLGDLGAAHTTMRLSFLIVLAGVIIFNYGKEFFKAISFPFFVLLFMIPIPRYLYDVIAFPLKLFVTKYAVDILNMAGVLALREGNIIMLENITLQVVDACSGIRSLTSIVVVAITLAYLSQKSVLMRTIIVLSAIPIAIIANIVRIVITGFLARAYGSVAAEGFFHEFAGLGVFGLEVFLLVLLTLFLRKFRRSDLYD